MLVCCRCGSCDSVVKGVAGAGDSGGCNELCTLEIKGVFFLFSQYSVFYHIPTDVQNSTHRCDYFRCLDIKCKIHVISTAIQFYQYAREDVLIFR